MGFLFSSGLMLRDSSIRGACVSFGMSWFFVIQIHIHAWVALNLCPKLLLPLLILSDFSLLIICYIKEENFEA